MSTFANMKANLRILPSPPSVFAYTIKEDFIVALNAGKRKTKLTLPVKGFDVLVNGYKAGITPLAGISDDVLILPARTGFVLMKSSVQKGK